MQENLNMISEFGITICAFAGMAFLIWYLIKVLVDKVNEATNTVKVATDTNKELVIANKELLETNKLIGEGIKEQLNNVDNNVKILLNKPQ